MTETAGVSVKRIMLVDDHPIVRQGLAQLLRQEADFEVCAEADDAHAALRALAQCEPDAAVVDISLRNGDGIALIKRLRAERPPLAILALSMHDESLYAERALRAGANGYIMKQEPPPQLLQALRQVLAGRVYVSERMASAMVQKLVGGGADAGESGVGTLSDRELEVFGLIGRGLSTREIAEALHVSIKTIESHRARIKSKLKARHAAELVQRAAHFARDDAD